MLRFSVTVMPGKIPRPSGQSTRPLRRRWSARILVTSWPSKTTDPDESPRTPERARMVEVLPAPLAPISETTSPSATCTLMPCSASILP